MWFAVFLWLYFLLAEIEIIPAEARTLCALLTLMDESGSGGGLQPQRSCTRPDTRTIPSSALWLEALGINFWKLLKVPFCVHTGTTKFHVISTFLYHGGIWRTIHCRFPINCYGTGLWVGDGIATPPPSTHTKSRANSVIINAKTTVHCSPDSSMPVSNTNCAEQRTDLFSWLMVAHSYMLWHTVLFMGRQKRRILNCLLSEESLGGGRDLNP